MSIKKTIPCLLALTLMVGSIGCGMKKKEAGEPAMMEKSMEKSGEMQEGMMMKEEAAGGEMEEMPSEE